MIVDGITIAAGGGINIRMIDDRRGPELPGSGGLGDLWELTEEQGVNVPGIYEYSTFGWTLRNPSISVLAFDVSGSVYGRPNPSDKVMMFVTPRTFTIQASYAGALAQALTPPASQQDFAINVTRAGHNDGSLEPIGVIRFEPGSSTGYYIPSTSAAIKINRGDMIVVFAPSAVDPFLEDVSFTICGHLSV